MQGSTLLDPHLSRREIQVISLVASGLTSKEVGSRLGISARTVNWHVSNVLSKLKVSSRTEAVAVGLELRLVRGPRPSGDQNRRAPNRRRDREHGKVGALESFAPRGEALPRENT